MPYCVRCGVELPKSSKVCPLCHTEVVLPDENDSGEGPRAFSDHVQRRVRPRLDLAPSRSFLFLMTFILIIPIFVTFFIDFTNTRTLTWSFYPMTSLALLWVLIAYPALLRGHTVLQVLSVDIFAIILFLLSLDLYSGPFPEWSQYPALSLLLVWVYLGAPLIFTWSYPIMIFGFWFLGTCCFLFSIDKLTTGDWFFPLGLPVTLLVALMSILGLVLVKYARAKPLLLVGLALFGAAVFFTLTDALVNHYLFKLYELTWSPAVSGALVPAGVFLVIVNGNADLKAYLVKKFHV